ncbi:MAG: outer membrane protein transport protein [Thermoanaerobaculia bacterium]
MRPLKTYLRILPLAFLLILICSPSFGAGFAIFEQGAKATAMGGAFAATADDPSAIFYNVAGIVNLKSSQAMLGGTMITFDNSFSGTDGYFPGAGVEANYANHTFVLPNAYFVMPIGENAAFGIGSFTGFGLRTDWADGMTFPGRYISQDANIKTTSVQPSFAMKMAGGKFAWGVGAEYRTSHISLERNSLALNPFTNRIADVAHARLNSDWNDAWGFDVGLMYKPTDQWNVGLQYRSAMDIDYTGTAKFTQISTGNPQFDALVGAGLPPNQDIRTTIKYPWIGSIGVSTTMIPTWQIDFDVVRTGWSRFKSLDVAFVDTPSQNLNIPEDWKSVNSYRLGANHPVTDDWAIRLGALYDKTPQPLEGVGPLLPDADRWAATFGFGWDNGKWSAEFAEMFLVFMDQNTKGMNRDGFNGIYRTTANLVTIDLGYKF